MTPFLHRGDVISIQTTTDACRVGIVLQRAGLENEQTMVYEVLVGTSKRYVRHKPNSSTPIELVPEHEYLMLDKRGVVQWGPIQVGELP